MSVSVSGFIPQNSPLDLAVSVSCPFGPKEGKGGCVWRKPVRSCTRENFRKNVSQRERDDNKNKICAFQGGVGRGAGRKIVQNTIFHGKRHDNKILKVKILLSRNFVVIAQAPSQCQAFFRATTNLKFGVSVSVRLDPREYDLTTLR